MEFLILDFESHSNMYLLTNILCIRSIPTLDNVANEMIENTEDGNQVILNSNLQSKAGDHPVIVRPATDWDITQPQSQSPHNQTVESNSNIVS